MEPQNNDDPTIPKDDAAKSPPPSGSKATLIKIKMPKKAEEAGEEVKSHYCKDCDRSFSSGKALGGHMSSAHVQANKDYSMKKLSSKRKASDSGSYSGYSTTCGECGRVFQSQKSLFGHMRCHPERDYRGMMPPPDQNIGSADYSSSEDDDDQIDSGERQEVGFRLKAWPTSKRGRGPVSINPVVRAPSPQRKERENDKDSFVAGLQLLRKLKQEDERRARPQPEIDQKKLRGEAAMDVDGDGGTIRRAEIERSGIKEKEENLVVKNQIAETLINSNSGVDEIDVRDDVYMTAIQVLVSGKREREREREKAMEEKGELSPSRREKYRCNVCGRNFTTHQALGGHRSSHNKFKLNVVNTGARDAAAALALSSTTPPPPSSVKSRKRKEKKIVVNTAATNDDNTSHEKRGVSASASASATASVPLFAFDLNVSPMEEDSSDHTSSDAS